MERLLDKVIEPKYRLIIVKISRKEIDEMRSEARKTLDEYEELFDGEDCIGFKPSETDVAVSLLLTKEIRLDCSPFEEAEGLPEFAIYYNWDVRSFCGRWGYTGDHQTIDECGLFFALVDHIEAQDEIAELIEEHIQKHLDAETILAYAILDTEADP